MPDLHVRLPNGTRFTLPLPDTEQTTVAQLREKVGAAILALPPATASTSAAPSSSSSTSAPPSPPATRPPPAMLAALIAPGTAALRPTCRLIADGRMLFDDEATLGTYDLRHGNTLYLAAAPLPSNGRDGSGSHGAAMPSGISGEALRRAASTAGAEAGRNGGGGGDPLGLPPGLSALLDSPLMQQLFNDPETMRALMLSDPRIQRMAESHPEIAHALADPSVLSQMMAMMRNPQARANALRDHDRQLARLESMPGGFAALSSIYQSLEGDGGLDGPLSGNDGGAAESAASNAAFAARLGATPDGPLPNPWAPPPPPPPTVPAADAAWPFGAGTAGMPGMAGHPLAALLGAMPPFGTSATPPGSSAGSSASAPVHPLAALLGGMGGLPGSASGAGGAPAADPFGAGAWNPFALLAGLSGSAPGTGPPANASANAADPLAAWLGAPSSVAASTAPPPAAAMMAAHPLAALFGGGMTSTPWGVMGGLPPAAPAPAAASRPPPTTVAAAPAGAATTSDSSEARAKYADELVTLAGMGFADEPANLRALRATGGNVAAAVAYLV
ncbi:hypothetical protein CXG81DRAFT_19065 [Caulochytrium protostelioides]|uniref:UBA domain-containing protein n=1 Tax=Caulochytrium protostelioides TaxID=1555241 RepID=A0A4P9X7C6_9FUNG|nr:hypothetical protein CXG81DRAFT_19065 [Caulochytrium protostelioides]|eukprot:RKP01112.1 hypothetical protein CXG81DRAFT_19065 [Caulochytrium protostelioides]